jgi:hypothetical protein
VGSNARSALLTITWTSWSRGSQKGRISGWWDLHFSKDPAKERRKESKEVMKLDLLGG